MKPTILIALIALSACGSVDDTGDIIPVKDSEAPRSKPVYEGYGVIDLCTGLENGMQETCAFSKVSGKDNWFGPPAWPDVDFKNYEGYEVYRPRARDPKCDKNQVFHCMPIDKKNPCCIYHDIDGLSLEDILPKKGE